MIVVSPLECGSELRICPPVAVMIPPGSPVECVTFAGLPPDVGFVVRQWSRSFARMYIASLVLRPLRKPDCDHSCRFTDQFTGKFSKLLRILRRVQ